MCQFILLNGFSRPANSPRNVMTKIDLVIKAKLADHCTKEQVA